MEEMVVFAEYRRGKGKSSTRKLRQEGNIPAILYGQDIEAVPVQLVLKDWERLYRHMKKNAILKMRLKKDDVIEEKPVMLKKIQRKIVKDEILHIDFLQVSMERKIEVEIPIHLVGTAKGLIDDGIVEQHLLTMMVECLPGQIPEKVDVDITNLGIGDSVHVNEVSLPGIRLLDQPDVAIVTVIPPPIVEEEPVEEIEEIKEEVEKMEE